MKNYIIAFALFMPLVLVFSGGALVYNLAGLAYALVLYRLAHTTKGKRFVNELYNYTEFLTDKYLRR